MKKKLVTAHAKELLVILKARFEKNMNRHKGLEWTMIQAKLDSNPEKLWTLNEREIKGGARDRDSSRRRRAFFRNCKPRRASTIK